MSRCGRRSRKCLAQCKRGDPKRSFERRSARLEHDEIRLNCNGNGTGLPLPLGEGGGEGLRSFVGPAPPHPICSAKSTSPRRGEVDCAADTPIQSKIISL